MPTKKTAKQGAAKKTAPKPKFDQSKGAKKIAREVVGVVKPSRAIPARQDKKPKHPKRDAERDN
jgi:hypothetical protein